MTNRAFEIQADFTFNPTKYLSYEKMVKKSMKDERPFDPLIAFARVQYPSEKKGIATIFKIDGDLVHKKVSDVYIHISPTLLDSYGKTPEEFLQDWKKAHSRSM